MALAGVHGASAAAVKYDVPVPFVRPPATGQPTTFHPLAFNMALSLTLAGDKRSHLATASI